MTTDFEKEDEMTLFVEPTDLLTIMESIFYKLKTCFSEDEHLFPLTAGYPELVNRQVTALAFFTKELLHRHGGKLIKKGERFM